MQNSASQTVMTKGRIRQLDWLTTESEKELPMFKTRLNVERSLFPSRTALSRC
jgi:hypothetical protein